MRPRILFLSVLLLTLTEITTSSEFDSDENDSEHVECGKAYNLGGLIVDDFPRHDHPW